MKIDFESGKIKLVNRKLSSDYKEKKEELNTKSESNKKATRLANYVGLLGSLIFILTVFAVIPVVLDMYFEINRTYSYVGGLILGGLLYAIGRIIYNRLPLSPLSINEQKFLKVVESLEDIEKYQEYPENKILRLEAARKLSKIESQMKEPRWNEYPFLKEIMKEDIDYLCRFRQNFKKMLLPNLIKGNEEDIEKVRSIVEKFSKYLLNPSFLELKDINKSMSELTSYPSEKYRLMPLPQLIPFFRHPYMRHVFFLITFGSSGYIVFHLGISAGASIDNAYTGGIGLFGALTAAYMVRSQMNP